ncbi:hypothetical protein J6590_025559 [Homalodisca vitripennis]|nr:hypothetical protein J6590_025559 [Homalodisca vitripennis]
MERGKEAVHKCHSDPGGSGAARRVRSYSGRKCVLTLDGYSYVIGELLCKSASVSMFYPYQRLCKKAPTLPPLVIDIRDHKVHGLRAKLYCVNTLIL